MSIIVRYMCGLLKDSYTVVKATSGRMMRQTGLYFDQKGSQLQNDIAYLEPLNRHRNILSLYQQFPEISPSAHVASNATVYGNVFVGRNSYFGFGSTGRGDTDNIRVGINTKIGQNTVLETNYWGNDQAYPLSVNIGNDVTIEHGCALMSCIVDDNVHIGFRTVVMQGSQIQRGAIIAPNSYVPAGSRIPAYTLWGGSPVKFLRNLRDDEKNQVSQDVKEQVRISGPQQ